MYTWLTLYITYLYIRTYYVCILYIHAFFQCFSLPSCHSQVVQHWRQNEGQDTNDHQQLLLGLSLDHLHQNHWLNGFRFFGQTSWHLQYPSNPSPKAFVMMSKPPKSLKLPWTKKQSASGNHSLHFHACLLHMFIAVMSSFTTYSLDNQTWSICFMSITSTPSAGCGGTFVSIHNFHNGQRTQEKEHHLVPVAVGMRTPKCVKLKDAFWTVSNNSVLNHSADFFTKSPAHRLRDIFQSLLDGSIKVGRRHIHSGADQGPNQDLEKEWSPQFHVLGYQFWKIRNWPSKAI